MEPAKISDDSARLKILRELKVLDTAQEKEFDDIVKLAAFICNTPISLISLVDENRQWFKAKTGMEQIETKREIAFCTWTIHQQNVLVIEDATKDARFANNPMVTGPEHIRFYAGVPITLKGQSIGALCVKDKKPRTLSPEQLFSLRTLSTQISQLLELRLQNQTLLKVIEEGEEQKLKLRESNQELHRTTQELLASEEEIRASLEQISHLQEFLGIREKQYRDLVENATDLIYELDGSGKFIFVNSIMEAKSGYSKALLLEKYYWELVHADEREKIFDFYKTQLKNRRETSYLEFRMISATQEEIWIGQNVRMFYNSENQAYRVLSISRDITALKKTEHKLEESEKLYRLLSLNSKDMVSLFEVTGGKVIRKFVSPAVKDILGYDPEELNGKGAFELVHPLDFDDFKRVTEDVVLKGKEASLEFRALTKDSITIWLESNITPVFDADGAFNGFQTATRDITARKQFEISLKEAKDRAEEATKAKSAFLSMISHEIRTPMNGIIGLTTLIMQNNPRPDQLENLKLLRFSGENLLTIINDILDFSKIEANKIVIESVELDLYKLLSNSKQMLEQQSIEKGIIFNFQYDPAIPKNLAGDPVRIAQIITNLASNAVKFTEKGSVSLTVAYKGKENTKHVIRFEVRDTGIGISPDKLQNIFDRFSQAETDTTRKFGGTGLGLSITKSLLETMGSKITVDSAPGHGSTFSFELSLPEVSQEAKAENIRRQIIAVPAEICTPATISVLLAEDNLVNQMVASGFLTGWGIDVQIANNGFEVLEMLKQRHYDVILMDLQMPEMDGYEASRAIRAMEAPYFKNLPIVALTASATTGIDLKVRESGMTDFISKPFSPNELRSKILKYSNRIEDATSV